MPSIAITEYYHILYHSIVTQELLNRLHHGWSRSSGLLVPFALIPCLSKQPLKYSFALPGTQMLQESATLGEVINIPPHLSLLHCELTNCKAVLNILISYQSKWHRFSLPWCAQLHHPNKARTWTVQNSSACQFSQEKPHIFTPCPLYTRKILPPVCLQGS